MSEEETEQAAPERPAFNAKILGISLAAAMGGFLFGFDTSVINGAIDAMSAEYGISGF
ncbi:MFS transporter, partial [Georgenia sp. 10Sc9-8]|nr:MFS transporter [Georgenia halotolerans]